MQLSTRRRSIQFPRQAMVMGILNLSLDSFSGDGLADAEAAIERSEQMIRDGADIVDLGAESARTNRGPISEQEEIDKLCSFIEVWMTLPDRPLLSINTWRPKVAAAALSLGGEILNDIGALPDDQNARVCAQTVSVSRRFHTLMCSIQTCSIQWINFLRRKYPSR
jgi:dihydropteroate synthase